MGVKHHNGVWVFLQRAAGVGCTIIKKIVLSVMGRAFIPDHLGDAPQYLAIINFDGGIQRTGIALLIDYVLYHNHHREQIGIVVGIKTGTLAGACCVAGALAMIDDIAACATAGEGQQEAQ